MGKKVMKKIKTVDAVGMMAWLDDEGSFFQKNTLPISLMYEMEKNKKVLSNIKDTYNEVNRKIEESYSSDEFSEMVEDEKKGQVRQVKPEYLNEFITKKQDLLLTENEEEFFLFKLDRFGDAEINSKDMSMLSFFIDESEDEDESEDGSDGE